ncbi:MAG: hypothetical protein K2P92_05220 [Bdellovibrionaceae bacterium]|nr:hypothetical protein [Pseudobdellovibrionaceae bacterium]
MRKIKKSKKNNSGFIVADFLFAFVMTISVGIFIFTITFSLATIEIGQYIIWSTARNYASANINESEAREQAERKFENLRGQFPLLTNSEGTSGWFDISRTDLKIGELDQIDSDFDSKITPNDQVNDNRQPWTGASTTINLKLFSNLQLPFLGRVTQDKKDFTFPVRAFIIRNVSRDECTSFFDKTKRYDLGIKALEGGKLAPAAFGPAPGSTLRMGEDNGC